MVLIIDDDIFVVNVGDSRALSTKSYLDGLIYVSQVNQITKDHKPSEPEEFQRIVAAGGYIYQTQTIIKNGFPTSQVMQVKIDRPVEVDSDEEDNPYVGPFRVFPGRLSVSRTFGDSEAKIES